MVGETVTPTEAGKRLGLRTREVYDLIDAGVLPLLRDEKGLVRVPVQDLEAYTRARSQAES